MPQSELPESWPLPPDSAPTLGGGRFRLAAQLGEGGMARVYRAWDMEVGQWVAVKVLLPEYARKRKLRKRFMNEAKMLLGMDHRNVVKVLAVAAENEDHPYIAMELADGGCVIDWVERYGPMPPRMAIDVVLQACKGLKAAHEQNIVHRDVKPHNILVTRRGVCRLTDFGIARLDDESGGITRTGSVMGTMGYMAPEQRTDSKQVDARADIYGLAATLYKLLTAESPTDLFLAEHDTKILAGVPDALVPVLIKATSYDKSHRQSTVTELAKELHGVKQGLPPDPDDTPDLAMEIDTGIDTTLKSRPELSDPTFADLPEIDPYAPTRAAPEATDMKATPVSTSSALPYSMPKQDQRRSVDDDYVPDYIDQESISDVPKRQPEEITLDDASKKRADAAVKRAIAAGRLNPDGTPIDAEVDDGPRHDGSKSSIEEIGDMAVAFLHEFLSIAWRPMQFIGVAALVIFIFGGGLVGTSAAQVNAAMVESHVARHALFRTIDENEVILGDLAAMGADEGMIQSFWFDYKNAPDKAKRVDATYKLVERLHSTFEYQRKHGSPPGGRIRIVRERLNRIDMAVTDYEEKLIRWEQVASGPRGQMAVSFGAAYRPGDPDADGEDTTH